MYVRKFIAALLIIAGGWLLLGSIGSIYIPVHQAQAQELPPRPTLTPVAVSEEPRSTPRPGRIVGTVIDLTTGAPAAGMTVRINDQELLTDGNGNYGRENLMPGTYVVELIVPPERGTSVQGAIPITPPEGETARQDLAFRSPVNAPSPQQAADTTPALPPAALPVTGASDDALWMGVAGMILVTGGMLLVRRATR